MSKINRPVYHVGLVLSDEEVRLQEFYSRALHWYSMDFESQEAEDEYYNAMLMEYGVDELSDMLQRIKEEFGHE